MNLVDRELEVHRDPVPDPHAIFGWRYRSVVTLAPPRTRRTPTGQYFLVFSSQ